MREIKTWHEFIEIEKKQTYFNNLQNFIKTEYKEKDCSPIYENIYNAFNLTPLEDVKVVIIGQDPYPTKGVAMGLAFSVNKDTKIPKSLNNMFLEAVSDVGIEYPKNGDLTLWAKKGILLLNRILTVEVGKSLAHENKGWEQFTKKAIELINLQNRKIVFILLGNVAKKIKPLLNNPNHLIIEAPHPSPLSAYHGFFGSKIYSKTCNFLDLPYDFWSLS